MKKVTLTFPNHDALWSFKETSNAVNVAVSLRKNMMSGLFSAEEVDNALQQFQAVRLDDAVTNKDAAVLHETKTTSTKPWFTSRFSHLLSLINL